MTESTRGWLLLGTEGCHLCEQAEAMIDDLALWGIVARVDIAEQTQWQAEFATKIPVLFNPVTKNRLCWPFLAEQIQAEITRQTF